MATEATAPLTPSRRRMTSKTALVGLLVAIALLTGPVVWRAASQETPATADQLSPATEIGRFDHYTIRHMADVEVGETGVGRLDE